MSKCTLIIQVYVSTLIKRYLAPSKGWHKLVHSYKPTVHE